MFWKKSRPVDQTANSNSASQQPNLGMMQQLAMKKLMSMSPEQQAKLMGKFTSPEFVQKNKDQILAAVEQLKATGMINDDQIKAIKEKFGL